MKENNLTKDKEIKVTREFLENECHLILPNGNIFRIFYNGKMYIIDTR